MYFILTESWREVVRLSLFESRQLPRKKWWWISEGRMCAWQASQSKFPPSFLALQPNSRASNSPTPFQRSFLSKIIGNSIPVEVYGNRINPTLFCVRKCLIISSLWDCFQRSEMLVEITWSTDSNAPDLISRCSCGLWWAPGICVILEAGDTEKERIAE